MALEPIRVSGLASGIDTESIIKQLMNLESIGLRRLQSQKSRIETKQLTYNTLAEKLNKVKTLADALSTAATYDAKLPTVDNINVLSATATASAIPGTYDVQVVRQSTATRLNGGLDIGTDVPGNDLNLTATINSSGLRTAVTGGVDPNVGSFTINGVAVSFNLTTDTLSSVMSRINNSAAGVTAIYDQFTDRMVLTNKTGGPASITVAEVEGNLATALKLTAASGAAETAGLTAQVTIAGLNNGNPIDSNDDVFTDVETGLTGLTFTLKAASGSAKITVGSDTPAVQKSFEDFAAAYNDLMAFIDSNSAISGTGDNKVGGPFTGDLTIQTLKRELRSILGQRVGGQPSGLDYLSGIGVGTSGRSPSITVFDAAKLAKQLTDNPDGFKSLLTGPSGLMTKLDTYLTAQTNPTSGLVPTKTDSNNDRISGLDDAIDRETRNLKAQEQLLRAQFSAMEVTISNLQAGLSQMLSNLPRPMGSSR